MGKTLLLTGASGYIAGHLVQALRNQEDPLVGVDRRREVPEGIDSFVQGDLCDPQVARKAVAGTDRILHLAAARADWGLSEEEYYHDNLDATRTLIEAGRKEGVTDWVFYSTVSVMGPSRDPLREDAGFNPTEPYGASKAEAEQLFRQLAADNPKVRVLIIRPSAVYGPGNPPDTNIYRLIDAIYNRRFVMVGSGQALKSTSYMENLLAATFFLMKRMERGLQTYIYVDAPVLTTEKLVARIYRFLGRTPPSWHVPLGLARPVARVSDVAARLMGIDFPITAARIEKFNRSTNFDASKIRGEGFEQPVSNEEALQKTVAWHLRHEYDARLPDNA
ncbi:MAG: NAD-dependent epimerase/dehydratase family protein [Salinibacter sp.]|uniref:NAD-dependent epimerase/dehydratase family protein n=1 Tax=Salinibacter sp. TaxID=2065818 RepID=UPI0035D4D02E